MLPNLRQTVRSLARAPTDPLTYVTVGLVLAAVAVLTAYVPARRATRVDPMEALRAE